MSTLQVKGGSGPAGRTLKTLNNKNNLVSLYMRKHLEQLNREHTFCISHIDRDKFETHDFLQHVQRTDSDKHPASIKYLGKTPLKDNETEEKVQNSQHTRSRRRRRHRRKEQSPQEKEQEKDTDDERENSPRTPRFEDKVIQRDSGSRLERERTFSIPNRSSLSTFTPLPSLDRKDSVYLQIAALNPGELSSDTSDDESEPTLELKTKDLSNRRRSSFVAWVQENTMDQKKKMLDRIKATKLKDNPLEQRRNSFANFMHRYKSTKKSVTPSDQLQDISEDASPDHYEATRGMNATYPQESHSDILKTILMNKTERRRKVVEPLNDRIDSFFDRINHLKVPVFNFNSPAPKLTAMERRRYTLLTKGIKAALADSSDEDD